MIRVIVVSALLGLVGYSALAQTENARSIPACGSPSGPAFVGDWLRLPVPQKAILRKGKDVDYQSYSIGFGQKKDRFWLWGGFGPTWSSGQVSIKLKESSTSFTEINWTFADSKLGGGVDAKGKLKNGNFWRYFGIPGETLKYEDVSKDAAEYFDSIINNICYRKPKWAR